MEIVSSLHDAIVAQVGRARFELWFKRGVEMVVSDQRLVVHAANQFRLDRLRNQFRSDLEMVARNVLGLKARVEFRVRAELIVGTSSEDRQQTEPAAKPQTYPIGKMRPQSRGGRSGASSGPNLSRRRFSRLSDFVVGPSNRVALTAAKMAVEQFGEASPVLLYGPPGSGKTHLLEGIWSASRRKDRQRRVLYLSAEQFTSYFLEALKGSGLPSFRRKYRGVDVLIIDDVQFFMGKQATLVEVLYTIDTMLRLGKQLVFSSSLSPSKLTDLGPELLARLTGGLVCQIDTPGMETRLEIVRRIAVQRSVQIPAGVARWMATHLPGDARQLSGAVNRLRATSMALDQPVTRSLAEQALGEMIRGNSRPVGLEDVERAVCDVLGMERSSLRTGSRARRESHPRMLAMWLARKHTRSPLSTIGGYFGRRSHTTVISAEKKVGRWMSESEPLQLAGRLWQVEDVVQQIEACLRTG